MWWLLAIFSGFFLYGIIRPLYTTVNNYVDQYTDVDCDGGGDSSQVYLTVVLREHPRTPANGAVIAGAKGRLAKVAKCCVHVHLPLFAVQRRSRCSAARGTSPRYLRLGQLLRVRAPFGEQRWAASRSAGV